MTATAALRAPHGSARRPPREKAPAPSSALVLRRLATRALLSRAGRILAAPGALPWERHRRVAELLGRLWDCEVEVPAVHGAPWRRLAPARSRLAFALAPAPVSIRETRPLPASWQGLGPIETLKAVASAALGALVRLRPRLHRSLAPGGGALVEASGTTILCAGLAEDGEEVLAVPWNAGEPFRVVGRRLVRARRALGTPLAAELWRAALRDWKAPRLPPPQAVISCVGHLGIENPETAPFASGGATPLAIVAGRASVSLVWDHRVYTAVDAAAFYEEFFS